MRWKFINCYRHVLATIVVVFIGFRWDGTAHAEGSGRTMDMNKAPIAGHVLYVAKNGNDSWSGQREEPNATHDDGPLASLSRALELVAQHRSNAPTRAEPVTVFVRHGTYFLDAPVRMKPEHSGTPNCPVTIAAYPGEQPILSGGTAVADWRAIDRDGRRVYVADLPKVRNDGWYFRQLWINGRRATRARHPNRGYFQVAAVPDVTQETAWHQGQRRFKVHAEDIPAESDLNDAEVVVMNRWVESRLPVISYDAQLLAFSKRSVFRLDVGDPYYVEHSRSALDTGGEWFLDRALGTLYYLPLDREDITATEAIAPRLDMIVQLEGDPKQGRWVEHVRWQGITFSHTEWYVPETSRRGGDVGGFSQAAVEVPGAVRLQGARHVAFDNCRIAHVGTYGLEVSQACHDIRLSGCHFYDLGAGGIKIGETIIRDDPALRVHSIHVTDCIIHDGGRLFPSAVAIWIGQSGQNCIEHCEIFDFFYTGISVGWTWGYGNSAAGGNTIQYNHVHHIGQRSDGDGPILSDMGGIYTLGKQQGTVIRNNVWHDISALRYGGWGIYFDEGSSDIVAENNLVYRTTHGGFHQHYGRDNIVRNNIFINGRDQQLQATRAESHRRFQFINNIVYGTAEKWLTGNLDGNYLFDRNLYWRPGGGTIRFGNMTFEEWQAAGMDKNSLIADPQFADLEHDDFRLLPSSPALQIGFQPFSWDNVGPRMPSSTNRR